MSAYEPLRNNSRPGEPRPIAPQDTLVRDKVTQQAAQQEQASQYAQYIHHTHRSDSFFSASGLSTCGRSIGFGSGCSCWNVFSSPRWVRHPVARAISEKITRARRFPAISPATDLAVNSRFFSGVELGWVLWLFLLLLYLTFGRLYERSRWERRNRGGRGIVEVCVRIRGEQRKTWAGCTNKVGRRSAGLAIIDVLNLTSPRKIKFRPASPCCCLPAVIWRLYMIAVLARRWSILRQT